MNAFRLLHQEVVIKSQHQRVWKIIEKHLAHPGSSPLDDDKASIMEVNGTALSQQRAGLGTRTRWTYSYRGKPFIWDDIVVEWIPEKRVAWKTTSGWTMEDSFTLRQDSVGTILGYDMRYQLPYGPLGSLYGRLILEPKMRIHLEKVLQRIKKLSENPLG